MNSEDLPEFMTIAEVSKYLRLSENVVRIKRREGAFPNSSRPGRNWLIPRDDVVVYLVNTRDSKKSTTRRKGLYRD